MGVHKKGSWKSMVPSSRFHWVWQEVTPCVWIFSLAHLPKFEKTTKHMGLACQSLEQSSGNSMRLTTRVQHALDSTQHPSSDEHSR